MDAGSAGKDRAGSVAGLILAAGASRRTGAANKLLLPLDGHALVWWAVQAAVTARLRPVVVVTGRGSSEVRTALVDTDAVCVRNQAFQRGISTSLRMGLDHLSRQPRGPVAAAVLLADEPELDPDIIGRVVEAWRRTRVAAARPHFRDRPGHPVVIGRAWWGEVARSAVADRGLDAWTADPENCSPVPVDAPGPIDVDTLTAYREVVARHRHLEP